MMYLLKRIVTAIESLVSSPPLPTGAATESTLADVAGCTLAASSDGTVTKSDSTVYSPSLRAVWATGAGNLCLMLEGDTTSVVTIAVEANQIIDKFLIRKVMSTGTTATGISGAK